MLANDETRISPISFPNEKPVEADYLNMRNRHSRRYRQNCTRAHTYMYVIQLSVNFEYFGLLVLAGTNVSCLYTI